MCWPSEQNMVCIQESFNYSVAVIIGEQCSDVFPLCQDYFITIYLLKKYCCLINGITLFLYKNYIVCQTLKSHHNI
jgi:hypothetical protein